MSMRDQIAEIVVGHWCSKTGNIDPVVMADDILSALPDMIAPLVWELKSPDDQPYWVSKGYIIQSFPRGWRWGERWFANPSEAKGVIDTHYRTAIMAAFTGKTK
jgi:hypothetical protein